MMMKSALCNQTCCLNPCYSKHRVVFSLAVFRFTLTGFDEPQLKRKLKQIHKNYSQSSFLANFPCKKETTKTETEMCTNQNKDEKNDGFSHQTLCKTAATRISGVSPRW